MKDSKDLVPVENIEPLIRTIRGQKVILDADLARLYRVETRAFNRGVKRNAERFPPAWLRKLQIFSAW